MDRDRSLDEFLGGDSGESAASDTDAGSDTDVNEDGSAEPGADESDDTNTDDGGSEPRFDEGVDDTDAADDADAADDGGNTATPPDDIEPAAVTYRWDPGGGQCTDCGATVEQLWSGESGQVCDECKEW